MLFEAEAQSTNFQMNILLLVALTDNSEQYTRIEEYHHRERFTKPS